MRVVRFKERLERVYRGHERLCHFLGKAAAGICVIGRAKRTDRVCSAAWKSVFAYRSGTAVRDFSAKSESSSDSRPGTVSAVQFIRVCGRDRGSCAGDSAAVVFWHR